MKRLLIPLTALIVAAIGWHLASPKSDKSDLSDSPDPTFQKPTNTITDPASVFQKAFWKNPTAEDQILHAERHEWQDKNGLSKWQWFLAVKPSSALVDHLITQNAFMLVKAAKPLPSNLPQWFQTSAEFIETYTNPNGTFHLLWDKEENLLHATDSGSGFRPGAPDPAKALTAAQPEGRLPTTPPPKP
jgi:hypothetical protein